MDSRAIGTVLRHTSPESVYCVLDHTKRFLTLGIHSKHAQQMLILQDDEHLVQTEPFGVPQNMSTTIERRPRQNYAKQTYSIGNQVVEPLLQLNC
jgi:hypothetical protein